MTDSGSMTNPSEALLRPCPFCGSTEISMSYSATMQSPEPAARFIECEECCGCGPAVKINDSDILAQESAIEGWNASANARAQQAATPAAPVPQGCGCKSYPHTCHLEARYYDQQATAPVQDDDAELAGRLRSHATALYRPDNPTSLLMWEAAARLTPDRVTPLVEALLEAEAAMESVIHDEYDAFYMKVRAARDKARNALRDGGFDA